MNDYQDKTNGVWNKVEKLISHKKYHRTKINTTLHDIAIIKLKEPIVFDTEVQPVKLLSREILDTENTAVAIGWGKTVNKIRHLSCYYINLKNC